MATQSKRISARQQYRQDLLNLVGQLSAAKPKSVSQRRGESIRVNVLQCEYVRQRKAARQRNLRIARRAALVLLSAAAVAWFIPEDKTAAGAGQSVADGIEPVAIERVPADFVENTPAQEAVVKESAKPSQRRLKNPNVPIGLPFPDAAISDEIWQALDRYEDASVWQKDALVSEIAGIHANQISLEEAIYCVMTELKGGAEYDLLLNSFKQLPDKSYVQRGKEIYSRGDDNLRRIVLDVLAASGDPALVPWLTASLFDARCNCSQEMADFGAALLHSNPHLAQELTNRLQGGPSSSRRTLLKIFGDSDIAEAFDQASPFLSDVDPQVRLEAAKAIRRLGSHCREVPNALRGLLHAPDIETRCAAVAALGECKDVLSISELIPLLGDSDTDLRGAAHGALCNITGKCLPLEREQWAQWWKDEGEQAGAQIERLLSSLRSKDWQARADAVRELVGYSNFLDRNAIQTALALRNDPAPGVRMNMCYFLGALRLPEELADIAKDQDPTVREAAAVSLARLNGRVPGSGFRGQ